MKIKSRNQWKKRGENIKKTNRSKTDYFKRSKLINLYPTEQEKREEGKDDQNEEWEWTSANILVIIRKKLNIMKNSYPIKLTTSLKM